VMSEKSWSAPKLLERFVTVRMLIGNVLRCGGSNHYSGAARLARA
jgi:hypothetical protein